MTDAAQVVMDQARRLREGLERGLRMEAEQRAALEGCEDEDDGGSAGIGGGADYCA